MFSSLVIALMWMLGIPTVAPEPSSVETIVGVPAEVAARVATGETGCVAIARDGRSIATIAVSGVDRDDRYLMVTDLRTGEMRAGAKIFGVDRGTDVAEWEELRATLAAIDPLPCHTAKAGPDDVVVLTSPPVTIEAMNHRISVRLDGHGTYVVPLHRRYAGPFQAEEAYWSDALPFLVLMVIEEGDSAFDYWQRMFVVPWAELEVPKCIARPAGPPVHAKAAPFALNERWPRCIAMTADGAMAAFRVFEDQSSDLVDRPAKVAWFGLGSAKRPDIDLTCFEGTCSPTERKAITARARELGLVACGSVRTSVVLDGVAAPWRYANDMAQVRSATGWRSIYDFGWDERVDAKLLPAFQHPAGGPVFLYVEGDGYRAVPTDVVVIDTAAIDLCP